jgi:polyhydroxybutyrate depolymerase
LNLKTLTSLCLLILATASQTQISAQAPVDVDFLPYQTKTLITKSGDSRKYLITLPSSYQAGDCVDAILGFHGAGGSAEGQFSYSGFLEIAEREKVILVHPDAAKEYIDQGHYLASYWNGAWEAVLRERDHDINFVLELVKHVESEHCIENLYAAGMSAGGDISSALACLTVTPFQSFAPVTYRYYYANECNNAGPRPIISFQGDNDIIVPISGSDAPWFDLPMERVMQRWSEHNNCDMEVIRERVSAEVVRYFWANCDALTEWFLIEGGSHSWPGSTSSPNSRGHTTQDISATELIWEFFKQS